MRDIYGLPPMRSLKYSDLPSGVPHNFDAALLCALASMRTEGQAGTGCVRHLRNESGEGYIAVYPVFQGCDLAYNDLRMGYCSAQEYLSRRPVIEINHCRSGRCEYSFNGGRCFCVGAGDFSVSAMPERDAVLLFPFCRYCGISVFVRPDAVPDQLKQALIKLSVDVEKIGRLTRARGGCFSARSCGTIEDAFSSLYPLCEKRRECHIRLKVLELLLILSDLGDAPPSEMGRANRKYAGLMREIKDFITSDMGRHHTITELSRIFSISPTAMKSAFKDVYGLPLYAYLRVCRLHAAREMLETGALSVADVASRVGYENPGKFTAAFRKFYGAAPSEYRRKCPNG